MTRWIACLGLVACFGGCDASKAELDSTKTQLTSVTMERDDLKKQVASLQKELETTRSQLASAKLPPAVAPATTPDPKAASAMAAGTKVKSAKK